MIDRNKENIKKILDRCHIKFGDLVMSGEFADGGRPTLCLVQSLSPANKFDRDYEGAEDHLMFYVQPIGGNQCNIPAFVDYACNMKKV